MQDHARRIRLRRMIYQVIRKTKTPLRLSDIIDKLATLFRNDKYLVETLLPELVSSEWESIFGSNLVKNTYTALRYMVLREFTTGIRRRMLEMGGWVLERLLGSGDGGYRGASIGCECGGTARFVGYREKAIRTALGGMKVWRAYYHCSVCGRGRIPQDERWDVVGTKFSPGGRRLMNRMGGKESFREGREDLQEVAGIEVGTKAVERMAEAVGEAIRGVEEERGERIWSGKVGPCCAPAAEKIVYIAVDGTGVPVVGRETEGHPGKGEDGRARPRG